MTDSNMAGVSHLRIRPCSFLLDFIEAKTQKNVPNINIPMAKEECSLSAKALVSGVTIWIWLRMETVSSIRSSKTRAGPKKKKDVQAKPPPPTEQIEQPQRKKKRQDQESNNGQEQNSNIDSDHRVTKLEAVCNMSAKQFASVKCRGLTPQSP